MYLLVGIYLPELITVRTLAYNTLRYTGYVFD